MTQTWYSVKKPDNKKVPIVWFYMSSRMEKNITFKAEESMIGFNNRLDIVEMRIN